MFANAVVDAFVVAAENYDVVEHRHAVGHFLVEDFAVRSGENHFVIVALRLQRAYAAVYRLYLYYHAGIASKGIVVDLAVAVGGVVAKIVHNYIHQPFVAGALDD